MKEQNDSLKNSLMFKKLSEKLYKAEGMYPGARYIIEHEHEIKYFILPKRDLNEK